MKPIYHISCIALIALFLVVFLTALEAEAEDNTCSIKSQAAGLFVNVYNVNPDGKPEDLIWQGKMELSEEVRLKSRYGRFFFNYSTDPAAYNSMISGMVLFCKNAEVVNIP